MVVVVVVGGAELEGGISSCQKAKKPQSETPHYSLLLKITTNKPNTFSQVIDYPDTSARRPQDDRSRSTGSVHKVDWALYEVSGEL